MDGLALMLPLQLEWEEPITTSTAHVLWERRGCSGNMDGVNVVLPLQFEWEQPIPTRTAQVPWER